MNATTEHACGTMEAPHMSVPGAALTAPAPTPLQRSDVMPDPTDQPVRKAISRRLRFEILRRDNHQCRYCGAAAPEVKLTVDHVVPVALGGTDEPSNLVAACGPCNAGKGSISPNAETVADVEDDAMRYARAMERAAQMRAENHEWLERALVRFHDEIWENWTFTDRSGEAHHLPLPDGWRSSVERFIRAGFTSEDMTHYVRVAMESQATHQDKFRYLCGCLWRELEERQKLARELMESGEV